VASAPEPLAPLPPELGESAPPEPPNPLALIPAMALAPLSPLSPAAPTAAAPAGMGENQAVVEFEQAKLAVQDSAIHEAEHGKHFMRRGRQRSSLKRERYLKRPNHPGSKLELIGRSDQLLPGLTPRDAARTERANASGKLVPTDGRLTVASQVARHEAQHHVDASDVEHRKVDAVVYVEQDVDTRRTAMSASRPPIAEWAQANKRTL
jgi:hypothetical protein